MKEKVPRAACFLPSRPCHLEQTSLLCTSCLITFMKFWCIAIQPRAFVVFHSLHSCKGFYICYLSFNNSPQWGAVDIEIKVPSGENTELKRSPFKVWSRSVYSHTCYAYCQEFRPRLFVPFRSSGPFTCIFSKTSPNFFLCWLWLTPDPV